MPKEFPDTGIVVPTSEDKHPSAGWWNILGATTNAAIVAMRSSVLASTTAMVDALRTTMLPRAEAAQYGIPGPPSTVPGPPGGPGPIGPGGAISLVETSTGCFTESATTWLQWDLTVGRVARAWDATAKVYGLVFGDTGLRDITALAPNVTAGSVTLQRVGNEVTIAFNDVQMAGASGSSYTMLPAGAIPLGFRPPATRRSNSLDGPPSARRVGITTGGVALVYLTPVPGDYYRGVLTYTTSQAWPTTLPGAPVGSIPV